MDSQVILVIKVLQDQRAMMQPVIWDYLEMSDLLVSQELREARVLKAKRDVMENRVKKAETVKMVHQVKPGSRVKVALQALKVLLEVQGRKDHLGNQVQSAQKETQERQEKPSRVQLEKQDQKAIEGLLDRRAIKEIKDRLDLKETPGYLLKVSQARRVKMASRVNPEIREQQVNQAPLESPDHKANSQRTAQQVLLERRELQESLAKLDRRDCPVIRVT